MTFLLQPPGAMEWVILYMVHFLLASVFLGVWGVYLALRSSTSRKESKRS
jgi:hypothetical protein